MSSYLLTIEHGRRKQIKTLKVKGTECNVPLLKLTMEYTLDGSFRSSEDMVLTQAEVGSLINTLAGWLVEVGDAGIMDVSDLVVCENKEDLSGRC